MTYSLTGHHNSETKTFRAIGWQLHFEYDYSHFSQRAAKVVIDTLTHILSKQAQAVVVPSAGRTPHRLYQLLVRDHINAIDWTRVVVVQMDEYVNLSSTSPFSMARYLEEHLIKPLGVKTFLHFYNDVGRPNCSLSEYEGRINDLGGIDLIVHGLGRNGHIGFNEPGSHWDSATRAVAISDSTLDANFPDGDFHFRESLRTGVTLGIRVLTSAKHAILLLAGRGKNTAVLRLLTDEPSFDLPASSLQLNKQVTVIFDLSSVALPDEPFVFYFASR